MKRTDRILLLIICALCLTGCVKKEPVQKTMILFDTVVTLQIFDSGKESLLKDAEQLCIDYENKFSRTIPGSDVSRINAAAGEAVEVSNETIELLEYALYYSRLSDGKFDLTIAPLVEAWDFGNEGVIPKPPLIEELIKHINYQMVFIEGNSVKLEDEKAAIDLGGIAKGYIADRLKEFFLENGVKGAVINLGGNVQTVGKKPDGSLFRIGLQKPFGNKNETIAVLGVKEKSVVSSGIYERYKKEGDMIYHHILNPVTGYPYDNNVAGVTIISDNSIDGDGLSTVCFALGLEKGMDLIESLEDTEAVFILTDGEICISSGIGTEIEYKEIK